MENQALINSIYVATEGEGIHIGRPQVFIRYQGCHIGCINCDSMDTWDFSSDTSMSLTKVLDKVDELCGSTIKNASITGGDPLHPKHVPSVIELIKQLKLKNFYVNIEAAGTRVVPEVFSLVDFISFDFKTPSTGVRFPKNNLLRMCEEFEGRFQIKAVVQDEVDFFSCLDTYQTLITQTDKTDFTWCLTPAFMPNEQFNAQRFTEIMQLNQKHGAPFRVIGQQHKWVFGPDQKQV